MTYIKTVIGETVAFCILTQMLKKSRVMEYLTKFSTKRLGLLFDQVRQGSSLKLPAQDTFVGVRDARAR